MIQPLTSQQVDDYLIAAGEQLALLRVAIRRDQDLQILGKTPFILNVLVLAYQKMTIADLFMLLKQKSPTAQRQQIFEAYVRRMLKRREENAPYSSRQVLHWLNWLAKRMLQFKQTEFYIERMQKDWLPEGHFQTFLPGLILGAMLGLAVGLIFALAFVQLTPPPVFSLLTGLRVGLFNAFLLGLYNGVIFRVLDKQAKKGLLPNLHFSPLTMLRHSPAKLLGNRIVYGLFIGLLNAFFLISGLAVGKFDFSSSTLLIIESLLDAAFIGIGCGLIGRLDTDIHPAEVIVWSWKKLRRNILKFLVGGLFILILFLLIIGPISTVVGDIFSCGFSCALNDLTYFNSLQSFLSPNNFFYTNILSPLPYGLVFVLIFGFFFIFRTGLTHGLLIESSHVKPNQGILNSARNSIWLGLIAGFVFSLIIYLLAGQITLEEQSDALGYALPAGLAVAIGVGLLSGGLACIQHFILRFLLWSKGTIPWNYSHFLNDSTDIMLLRKVGGGYIFLHRLLLEYFATLETPSFQIITRRTIIKGAVGLSTATIAGGFLTWIFSLDPHLIYTYHGHESGVNSVAWSPDGGRIASGGDDGIVQVRDATNGKIVLSFGYPASVRAVAWSPDGKRLAFCGDDSTAQLWDVASDQLVLKYSGHSARVRAMAWSPDGRRIASGGDDGTVQVWDTTSGGTIGVYKGHAYWYQDDTTVNTVTWSPDGRYVASGSSDKVVQIWSVQ